MNLALAHTALLVIDMQRDFCALGGYADQAGMDVRRLRAPIPAQQRLLAERLGQILSIHTGYRYLGHEPEYHQHRQGEQDLGTQVRHPHGVQHGLDQLRRGRLLCPGGLGLTHQTFSFTPPPWIPPPWSALPGILSYKISLAGSR